MFSRIDSTETVMAILLALLGFGIYLFSFTLTKKDELISGNFLPLPSNIQKRQFEIYALKYTAIWILIFGVVIVTKSFLWFSANDYMALCVTLSLPFLLQPILAPLESERNLPLTSRYSFKANVWIAIFSFIGNYWYTHYFYSVLKAKYTFPSHRLNDVPIALFFATHFYFVTYHSLSNLLLRKIESTYLPGTRRTLYFWTVVFAFSYFTAFMETLTISSFPYYSFEDRNMAYTIGSAFYGLYFIVSYPIFYRLDEKIAPVAERKTDDDAPHSMFKTVMEAMGTGMIVLLLLDFCRIFLNIPLVIPGKAYYLYKP